MSILQIQPQISHFGDWTALASQQGLFFELLELSSEPLRSDKTGLTAAVNAYRNCGRVRSLHGAFIDVNPASADTDFRALSRLRCEESCRLSNKVGADTVVFHSSCFPFLNRDFISRWADTCAEYYLSLAARFGLTLCIENCADPDPQPLTELMRRTASPAVGVCLDIGHANYSRTPLEGWFDALQHNIRYLHLSDNSGMCDDHMTLGSGTVDWLLADKLWRDIGCPERLTLEVCSLESVSRSLAFLKENHLFGQE